MNPQSPLFTIAIIGGGLAIAIFLLHQSIPAKIYKTASCFSEIGAGVAFGPNTLRTIAAIDPALNAAYECCATRNAWSAKRRQSIEILLKLIPSRTGSRTRLNRSKRSRESAMQRLEPMTNM
jgi:2-polyprenyl-6-methoxyphenol hydroxylase-like FAD-dependent oxidoreductase